MNKRRRWLFLIIACVLLGVVAKGFKSESTEMNPTAAQDVIALDRRISMLERRLYSMESSISRLEQQISLSQRSTVTTAPAVRDVGAELLRSEVEILNGRMRELECGVVHLDERTLSPTVKEALRRSGVQPADPCRSSPQSPVKLSMHQ